MMGRSLGVLVLAGLCAMVAGCSLGGDPTPALTCLEPAASPDGLRLAYESSVNRRLKLFVRELATGEVRQITTGESDDFSPAWSPDGRWLAFASNREKGNVDVYTVDLASLDVRRLTADAGNDMYPAWSPNGRIYFNSDRGKAWQVYSILPDGTDLAVVVAGSSP